MKIKCPACANILTIAEESAGTVIHCGCGKRLRIPVRDRGPSPTIAPPPAAGSLELGRVRPATQTDPTSPPDELNEADLHPVWAASSPYTMPPPSRPDFDPLQGYAPTGHAAQGFSTVGSLATLGQRIGGAVIDSALMMGLGLIGAMLAGVLGALIDSNSPDLVLALAQFGFYGGMILVAVVNAVLITLSGQSVGKKIAGSRIVDRQSGRQVGFLQGVLLRNLVFGLITWIPCVGLIVGLVDLVFLFPEPHETLHDKLASTAVVKA